MLHAIQLEVLKYFGSGPVNSLRPELQVDRLAPFQWTVSKDPADRSSKAAGLTLRLRPGGSMLSILVNLVVLPVRCYLQEQLKWSR